MNITFNVDTKNLDKHVNFDTREEMIEYLRNLEVDLLFKEVTIGKLKPLKKLSDKELKKYYVED